MKQRLNHFIENYRLFTEKAYMHHTGWRRLGVCICNMMLSLYIVIIASIPFILPKLQEDGIFLLAVEIPLFVLLLYQLIKLIFIKIDHISVSRGSEKKKLSTRMFFAVAAVVFVITIIDLLALYPGGISRDNIGQWSQVQNMQFSDWHPAIHTMLIWLVTRIIPSYTFFIAFQILIFSLGVAYMAVTLSAWGIGMKWVLSGIFISVISSQEILLFAWKDTAFTICLLFLSVCFVNIIMSNGL